MKFLTTYMVASELESIIKEAKKELTLVTPYLDIPDTLYQRLQSAAARGVQLSIIYGKSSLSNAEDERIKSLPNLELYYFQQLHAKCYYSERALIITSMNLYAYSEKNNREMGILVNTGNKVYKEAVMEITDIKSLSNTVFCSVTEQQSYERETLSEVDPETSLNVLLENLNRYFKDKVFKTEYYKGNKHAAINNYQRNIDIYVSYRVEIILNFPKARLNKLYSAHKKTYDEFRFDGFKYYWNYATDVIFIYKDTSNAIWNNDIQTRFENLQWGINSVLKHILLDNG